MPFPSNTPSQIFTRLRQRIAADGRFTALSSTSTTRLLMELISSELGTAHLLLIQALEQGQLSNAVGENLENLGELVGVVRRTATRAVDNTRANVRFFVDPALGLDLTALLARRMPAATVTGNTTLTDTSMTIKSGMIITDGNRTKRYITTEDVTLKDKEIFVPVIAEGIGPTYNVGVGELSRWDWQIQPEMESIKDFILVTNAASISSGTTTESDDALRARIFTAVPDNATSNGLAVRAAALSVPGVRTASVIGGYKGPSTYKVNVTGTSPIVSEGLMNNVRQAVLSASAVGTKAFVDRPTYLGVEIKIILLFRMGTTDREVILAEVRNNIVEYVNSIPSGEALFINELRERIQVTSESILDHIIASISIGTFNPDTAKNENARLVSTVNQRTSVNEQFYTNPVFVRVCD